jgi:hypothetical protein
VHAGKTPEEEVAEIELVRAGRAAEAAQLDASRRAAEAEERAARAAAATQLQAAKIAVVAAARPSVFEGSGSSQFRGSAGTAGHELPPARLNARLQVARASVDEEDEAAGWSQLESHVRDAGDAATALFGSFFGAPAQAPAAAPLPPPQEPAPTDQPLPPPPQSSEWTM